MAVAGTAEAVEAGTAVRTDTACPGEAASAAFLSAAAEAGQVTQEAEETAPQVDLEEVRSVARAVPHHLRPQDQVLEE